mmetsp:Transcript_11565/g.19264  ORF Transcript_11565/g.19264 Transcript_11565/m.19264 type:complete len:135 (-) Transcript_11565:3183-3587(-)
MRAQWIPKSKRIPHLNRQQQTKPTGIVFHFLAATLDVTWQAQSEESPGKCPPCYIVTMGALLLRSQSRSFEIGNPISPLSRGVAIVFGVAACFPPSPSKRSMGGLFIYFSWTNFRIRKCISSELRNEHMLLSNR